MAEVQEEHRLVLVSSSESEEGENCLPIHCQIARQRQGQMDQTNNLYTSVTEEDGMIGLSIINFKQYVAVPALGHTGIVSSSSQRRKQIVMFRTSRPEISRQFHLDKALRSRLSLTSSS